jgi:hypothetical protein
VTRKEMSDQVTRWLGLQDITDYSETSMVYDQLYWGTIDLLARTRCIVRCVDLRTRAGQDEYTLDHSLLGLVDVENGARPRYRRNQSGGPAFTLVRSDVLIVKPAPDADGEIQVWGVLRPQKMQQDTDSPGDDAYGAVPDEFQDAIVTYALWKLSDYSDDATGQQGERYRMLYEGQDGRGGRIGQIKIAVNKRGTAKAPQRKVSLSSVQSYDSWIG